MGEENLFEESFDQDEQSKKTNLFDDSDAFSLDENTFNANRNEDFTLPEENASGFNTDAPAPFVSIASSGQTELQNKDSNFVFFFGTGQSGKSIILSSMLYYLSTQVGELKPCKTTPNTKEAEVLLYDFISNISKGILPARTDRDKVTRMDLEFSPNNPSKKVPPIKLTFLESSGENHQELKRGGKYHNSIDQYLNAHVPLNIIIVTSYEKAHEEDALINSFLNDLVKRGIDIADLNVLLVISKWDLSGSMSVSSEEELDDFIKVRLPMTNSRFNKHNLPKTYYTIGQIENPDDPLTQRLSLLSLETAEIVSKWLYKGIAGYDLDYEGTFWERIKFSIK